VVLCAHDPITGADHRGDQVTAPSDAVLIVDTVFAFRPEYNQFWDYRIWLEVPEAVALARGVARDTAAEGGADQATRLHRDRYEAAVAIYLAEVSPRDHADLVIDNEFFDRPRLL
jgi:uridine kinase